MSQATVESGKVEKVAKGTYPKSMGFILSNVFFERFCSGGIIGESLSRDLERRVFRP